MHRRAVSDGSAAPSDRWPLFASALAAVVMALMLTVPSGAQASVNADPDYWKGTAERRDIVSRLVYSQSPQAIPSAYDPVREAEEILRQQQRTLPASNPKVLSLWQQLRTTTVRTGLSTPMRALGTIGLAVGSFEIGWKIGTGINAKFLRIGVPEAVPHTNTDFRGNGSAQLLTFYPEGTDPYFGRVILPEDGFIWERKTDSGRYSYWRTGAPEDDCDMNRVVPPPELEVVTSGFYGPHCGYLPDRATDYHIAYVPEDEMVPKGPIEPYTNQPFSKSSSAPTAPTQSTVESTITTQLDDPKNQTLRDWLNYKLGSPGQDDPTGEGETNPITYEMPNCPGLTYDACAQAIRDTGFDGPVNRVDRTFETADVTKPGDAVLDTDPNAGARVDADGSVTVDANPPAALMPVVIPGIQPGETYEEYAERLRDTELEPVREDATEITLQYGPDGAMSTRPGTGTRTSKDTDVVVVTRPRRQRCDLSDPTDEYMVGTGQNSMDLFTGDPPRYPSGADPVFFTPRNLLRPSTTLRWGTTSPQPPPILWDGFGYRHIGAKHGWSPADEAVTRDVLSSTEPVAQPGLVNDRWRFVGTPYAGRDGRPCVRVVVVDYGIRLGNTQPEGIITSYGSDPL